MLTLSDVQRRAFSRTGIKPIWLVEFDVGPIANLTILSHSISSWSVSVVSRFPTDSHTFTEGVDFNDGASIEATAQNLADAINAASAYVYASVFGATVSITARTSVAVQVAITSISDSNAATAEQPYGLVKTIKFVSGGRPYRNSETPSDTYASSIASVAAIASSIDPATRAQTIGAAEITINDPSGLGFFRQILQRCNPKGRFVRLKIGFHDLAETDFLQVATYIIDDCRPEPGKIVVQCGEPLLHSFEASITAQMLCVHPLAAIRSLLQSARVPSTLVDLDTLDETDPSYADISHWAVSRNAVFPTPKVGVILPDVVGPEWMVNTIDDPVPAKPEIDALGSTMNGTLLLDESGVYGFVRYDGDATSVRDLTTNDVSDFEIVALAGQNLYNKVSVKTSTSGGPLFEDNDEASRRRVGVSGESTDFTLEFTNDWLGNAAYLARSITEAVGQELHSHGAVGGGHAGSRPEVTAVYRSLTYPTQRASDQLSADDGRYAYFLLLDLGDWRYEIVRANTARYFDPVFEDGGYNYDGASNPILTSGSTGIEEVTPYPGTPDGFRFAFPDARNNIYPALDLSFDDYFTSPDLDSPVRVIDRVVYTLDQRALYGSTVTGGWEFNRGNLVSEFLFFAGVPNFVRIIDITIPVAMVQSRLERFANGCPVIKFRTSLRHVDLQVTDIITVTHPLYVEFKSDGSTSAIRWEIISKEIDMLGDSPGVIYTCARVGSPGSVSSIVSSAATFRPGIGRGGTTNPTSASDAPPVIVTGGSGLSASGGPYTWNLPDDTTGAWVIQEGSNHYLYMSTENDNEVIVLGHSTAPTPSLFFYLPDNEANAAQFLEGSNNYIHFRTTNSDERITYGNDTATSPSHSFLAPANNDAMFEIRDSNNLSWLLMDSTTGAEIITWGEDVTNTPAYDIILPEDNGLYVAPTYDPIGRWAFNIRDTAGRTYMSIDTFDPSDFGSYIWFQRDVSMGYDENTTFYWVAREGNGRIQFHPESGFGTKVFFVGQRTAAGQTGRALQIVAGQGCAVGASAPGAGGTTSLLGATGAGGNGSFAPGAPGNAIVQGGPAVAGTSSSARAGGNAYLRGNAGVNGGASGIAYVGDASTSEVQLAASGINTTVLGPLQVNSSTGSSSTVLTGGSTPTWTAISSLSVTMSFATPSVEALTDASSFAAGSASTAIRSDARLIIDTAAPGTNVTSDVNSSSLGSATTSLRSDARLVATTAAPSVNVLSDASSFSQGTSASLLRADARFIATTASASNIGATNTQGSSTSLARADHTHAVIDLAITSQAQGDIIYFNGTNWVRLAPGTDGYHLTTHGAGANPTWTASAGASFATPTVEVLSDASSFSAGSAGTAMRSDARLIADTSSGVAVGAANGTGTATTLARADHTHAVTDLSITSQAQGDILYFSGSNWVRLAPSTDGYVLTTHGASANPTWAEVASGSVSFATPTVEVLSDASSFTAGAAATAIRSDARLIADTSSGVAVGAANGQGTATTLARADHTHAVTDLSITSQARGDIVFFNGTNWVRLAASTDGRVLTTHGAGADPTWTTVSSGSVTFATPTVEVLSDASSFAGGASGDALRSDCRLIADTSSGVSVGAANGTGTATSLARADHTHAVTDLSITSQATGDLLYFSGTNWVRLAVGTSAQALIGGTTPAWAGALNLGAGSAMTATYSTTGDTNTGIYFPGADQVAVTTSGTQRLLVTSTVLTSVLPWQGPNGSATDPALSASADTNTGVYFSAADTINLTTGGTSRVQISTTALTSTLPIQGPDGSVSAPAFSFSGDTDNGLYRITTNSIGMAIGGALSMRWNSTGVGINTGPSTQFHVYDGSATTEIRIETGGGTTDAILGLHSSTGIWAIGIDDDTTGYADASLVLEQGATLSDPNASSARRWWVELDGPMKFSNIAGTSTTINNSATAFDQYVLSSADLTGAGDSITLLTLGASEGVIIDIQAIAVANLVDGSSVRVVGVASGSTGAYRSGTGNAVRIGTLGGNFLLEANLATGATFAFTTGYGPGGLISLGVAMVGTDAAAANCKVIVSVKYTRLLLSDV